MKLSSAFLGFLIATVLLSILLNSALNKSKRPKYKLAIGILSARENFVQRDTIRSTWLSVIKDSKLSEEVFASFLLANEDCKIPQEYRKSRYSCEEIRLPHSVPVGVHGLLGERAVTVIEDYPEDQAAIAFDFVVTHDVVISGISVPNTRRNDAVVQLWDLASNVLVVESATYNLWNKDEVWEHRQIDAYLLAKGFVGSVVVSCGSGPCVGVKDWFNKSSFHLAVEISPIIRYSIAENEFPTYIMPINLEEMLLPASLSLQLKDPDSIEKLITDKPHQFDKRLQHTRKISTVLKKESERHEDVVLLTDINGKGLNEVYRNLPRKVICFHKWCNENLDAEFIMKTDDDSYIDIEKVLQILEQASSEPSKEVWLGNFRRNWPVDTYGKWGEYSYTSPVYPAYACGAAYIVSAGVSRFLSENKDFLKWYQGEDVSMGIWLSALDVHYSQENRFICDSACFPSLAVSTQHSRTSMLQMWTNKLKCSNPCECY